MAEAEPAQGKPVSTLRKAERHIRNRLISGVFVLVPLGITVAVITFIANAMAGFVRPAVRVILKPENPAVEIGISIAIFILLVYVVGMVTAHLVGRRLVALGEAVILRIPVAKTIYSVTKQVVSSISLSRGASFKSVVMVEFPRPGVRTLGFVTGTTREVDGKTRLRVFVPTAPNPTSGYLLFVAPEEAPPSELSVEEAIKMIVSGGVLAPEQKPAAEAPNKMISQQ